MNDDDMATIAQWILTTLRHPEDAAAIKATQDEVNAMCRGYPVPGIS